MDVSMLGMDRRKHLEDIAEEIYRAVGATSCEVWKPSRIARALYGDDALILVPGLLELAQVSRVHGQQVIALRMEMPRPIREWVIAHELAHLFGVVDEDDADYVGAAIQMRREAFLSAQNGAPDAWAAHAARFCVTSTSAVLRAAEVEDRHLAVVTYSSVHKRGNRWPDDDPTMRVWAINGGGPGVRAARLPDAPRRVMLEATG